MYIFTNIYKERYICSFTKLYVYISKFASYYLGLLLFFFLYLYQNISLAKISLVFCFDRIKFQTIAIATEYKTNLATFITLNQCRMLKEGRNVENV